MADIGFLDPGNLVHLGYIDVVESMAHIDSYGSFERLFRAGYEFAELSNPLSFSSGVGEFAGMKLDEWRSNRRCRLDLGELGINEKADDNPIL